MPIYEYSCKTCGKEFEMMAGIGAAAPQRGPDCTSSKCVCERRLSVVATPRRSATTAVMEKAAMTKNFDIPDPAPTVRDPGPHQCTPGCAHTRPDLPG